MTDLLRELLPTRDGLFVDVGVNLGQTLVKVKDLDPGRAYLGFEPNPACVAQTERMLTALGFSGCRIIPAGLWPTSGVVQLEMISKNPTGSAGSVIHGFRSSKQIVFTKTVVVLSIEDLPSELFAEPVAFLKVDVEGGELEVLQTLRPIIERDQPIILIEILPCYSDENRNRIDRQAQSESLLREWGYKLERIIKKRERLEGLEHIDHIGIHGDLTMCDYVASPLMRAAV